jgi:hypothetical protein
MKSRVTAKGKGEHGSVAAYERAQKPGLAVVCRALRKEIEAALPKATARIYHSIPVWFIGENAVVGFNVTAKNKVNLLFWNGQALDEQDLKAVGKFKAAQIQFQDATEIDRKKLRQWLKKAGKDIWDFTGLRKGRG